MESKQPKLLMPQSPPPHPTGELHAPPFRTVSWKDLTYIFGSVLIFVFLFILPPIYMYIQNTRQDVQNDINKDLRTLRAEMQTLQAMIKSHESISVHPGAMTQNELRQVEARIGTMQQQISAIQSVLINNPPGGKLPHDMGFPKGMNPYSGQNRKSP